MNTNYRGLALLLSIGSLPLACAKEPADTEGDDSTTAGTTTNNSAGTGTGTDTTQASDPTSTGGTTTTGMGQTDTTADTTETQPTTFLTSNSETGDSETDDDTNLPPATDPNCIAFGAHMADCIPRLADYAESLAQGCEYGKMMGMVDGEACVQAIDAFYVCMSMTECAELTQGEMSACLKEQDAWDAACPSMEDFETDSDSDGAESTSG